MVMEFVDGWDVLQTLGEGAYGEVKLLVNRATRESVAMKVLDLRRDPQAQDNIRKEVCIHRMLNDKHIIKFYGQRQNGSLQYIFLEYAAGGELFDRIEPDVGMDPNEAAKYFRQLILGVEYLHTKGIAHRDLKPENLLLDDKDNLRISDFGMATLFRNGGRERLLEKRCGTLPYIAPEVLLREYYAEPADLWSCGIILVALLAGELPWDMPNSACPEYCKWRDKIMNYSPWSKITNITNSPLSLLRNILTPSPAKRFKIMDIKSHFWFSSVKSSDSRRKIKNDHTLKRVCSGTAASPISSKEAITRLSSSQPQLGEFTSGLDEAEILYNGYFSQPAHPEDMILSTQTSTQTNSQTPFQKLVKRMTRFFVKIKADETQILLKQVFSKLSYIFKTSQGMLTVSTADRRKIKLVFIVNLIEMDGKILVDFRLSKGDGIEFKRHFLQVKNQLLNVIVPGPITWPIAVATNTVP